MFKRELFDVILARLGEEKLLIQVISGPRQVGKTTLVRQVLDTTNLETHYVSADGPGSQTQSWIQEHWEFARIQQKKSGQPFLLVLDEVQKVPNWSESVKQYWDEDRMHDTPIKIVLLGSAPLLMQKGLTESLAGRFEVLPLMHWSWPEMREAFDITLEQYCYFGGYPGAVSFMHDETRWQQHVLDSLIDPTLAKDILLMQQIKKPALLRQLFYLCCDYSGQILSYQKMLGQLDDAGNTVTLADYLRLLDAAGMIRGLQKFTQQKHKQRASSPKLQVYNNALMAAQSLSDFNTTRENLTLWGRIIESTVGAHLLNASRNKRIDCLYWRDRNQEVDFVLQKGDHIIGIEVKSGARKPATSGMAAFQAQFPEAKLLQVGGQGMPLAEFLNLPIENLL